MKTENDELQAEISEQLISRYGTAYRQAKLFVESSKATKVIAICVGAATAVLIFGIGYSMLASTAARQAMLSRQFGSSVTEPSAGGGSVLTLGVVAVGVGLVAWFVVFFVGNAIAVAGQLTLANLDTAVNTSPHISQGQKDELIVNIFGDKARIGPIVQGKSNAIRA